MIDYIENGLRMHEALSRNGTPISKVDGVWVNKSNKTDEEINIFIANYDPLPEAKADAIERLRSHVTSLVLAIYPYPETADIRDIVNHLQDCGATGQGVDDIKAMKVKFLNKRKIINDDMDDWQEIDALDVTVGW